MVQQDENLRPTANDSLRHPFFWTEKKKMEFLRAVANQPAIASPSPAYGPLNAFESELEAELPRIVRHGNWNDAKYKHMPAIYAEMTNPIVRTGKKGKSYTMPTRKYDTGSVADLVRFIRNSLAHVSEASRPNNMQKQILDGVFLREFPELLIEVYKLVDVPALA